MPSSRRLGKLPFWPVAGLVLLLLLAPRLPTQPVASASLHWTPHDPIQIIGNTGFNTTNGVTGGSGTEDDPYLIEGWRIEPLVSVAIDIRNTTSHFVIRDVSVDGDPSYSGIQLSDVANATLQNATITGSLHGLRLSDSDAVLIAGTVLEGNGGAGLFADASRNVTVTEVSFLSNTFEGALFVNSSGVLLSDTVARSNYLAGLKLVSVVEAAVRNSTFSENNRGIDLEASDNVTVSDSHLSKNNYAGIAVDDSQGFTLERSGVYSNLGYGLRMSSTQAATLVGNKLFSNLWDGIRFESVNEVSVERNNVTDDGQAGMTILSSTNVTLRENVFAREGVFLSGLVPAEYTSHTLVDNLVNGRLLRFHKDCVDLVIDAAVVGQVLVVNCTGVRIANLSIADTATGILIAHAQDVSISNVAVSGSVHGVHVSSSDGVVLRRNVLFENQYGLVLHFVKNASVDQNDLTSQSQNGIRVQFSSLLNVTDNIVRDSPTGLFLRDTSNVTLTGNVLELNTVGVSLNNARGVVAFNNTFMDNNRQASDDLGAVNRWDGGYPVGGNTWSDYFGVDRCRGPDQDDCTGADGLGDTPYVIDADSADRYPRVLPNYPPIADFRVDALSFTATGPIGVDASISFDLEDSLDLLQVRWDWENDSVWDTGWSPVKVQSHRYDVPGTYEIRLAVRDTGGLVDTATRMVSIGPNRPPLAEFSFTPRVGNVETLFRFQAKSTLDPEDPLTVLHRWDFEDDGSWDTSWNPWRTAAHQYPVPGTYPVRLEVQDRGGLTASATRDVVVGELPEEADPFVPTLTAVTHPDKPFRVGVPAFWEVNWDYELPDVGVADFIAFGPVEAGFQTNFLVASEGGVVTESDPFLLEGADQLLTELALTELFSVTRPPEVILTINARAVVFVIQYLDEPILQVLGLIVNENHSRGWILVGSSALDTMQSNEALFIAMIESFELEEIQAVFVPPNLLPIFAALGAAAGAGVGLGVWLWRRRSRPGPSSRLPEAAQPGPANFCRNCGAPLRPMNRFCGNCGFRIE